MKSHVIQNHTRMHIPAPIEKFKIDVKQKPGLSYPQPPNHVHIVEKNYPQRVPFLQPAADRNYILPGEMPPMPVKDIIMAAYLAKTATVHLTMPSKHG